MINVNNNTSFSGLYKYTQKKNSEIKVSDKWGYEALESTLGKKISLPSALQPFSDNVSEMQKSIISTTDLAKEKKQQAEQYKNEVSLIYKNAINGKKSDNVLCTLRRTIQNEYATLTELDDKGSIKRISHLRNGEVAVIYELLSDVNASSLANQYDYTDLICANGYYYSDNNCVEYVEDMKNLLKNYAADFDFLLPDKQWPSRNSDDTPVKQVIGFKDNGSFRSYSHYLYGIPQKYKESISFVAGKDGKVDVKFMKENGLTYSYTNEYKYIGYPQHTLQTGNNARSKIYVW